MGTANHRVNVVRINELEKHPNADNLSLVRIDGYQVVVRTDSWKVGDLAIYIQPDSVVPDAPQFAFLWEGMTFPDGVVPEKRRRVTVRRFRKEYSEGLLLPLSDFRAELTNRSWQGAESDSNLPPEGLDVAEYLGITHYEPPEDPQSTTGDNENAPGSRQSRRFPRSIRGWVKFILSFFTKTGGHNEKAPTDFRPVYDVESIKNFGNVLVEDELVIATEKIHGSNARYTFTDGKMYAGSRKLWKAATSGCIWRKVLVQHPWIEEWCRANEGYTLYGEVVPTQGKFDYGCKNGETKFFVFDILTPDGKWVSPGGNLQDSYRNVSENWVPIVIFGNYHAEDFKAKADGPSFVSGANHIREGIVIRPIVERHARNLGRVQLKVVSNAFLEKDSK